MTAEKFFSVKFNSRRQIIELTIYLKEWQIPFTLWQQLRKLSNMSQSINENALHEGSSSRVVYEYSGDDSYSRLQATRAILSNYEFMEV